MHHQKCGWLHGIALDSSDSRTLSMPAGIFARYLSAALIYAIALPQRESIASFEKVLLSKGAKFGIRAWEQDRIMQHQKTTAAAIEQAVRKIFSFVLAFII